MARRSKLGSKRKSVTRTVPAGRAVISSASRDRLLALIGERMRRARVEVLSLSQRELGKALGQQSGRGVQDNERGLTMPSGDTLWHLLSHGVSANWLLSGVGATRIDEDVSGWARVTNPLTNAPLLALSPIVAARLNGGDSGDVGQIFGWPVSDPAMSPALMPGDIAICRATPRDHSFAHNAIVLYRLSGDDSCMLRNLTKLASGNYVFRAANRNYGPVEYTREEITSRESPIEILGEVVAKYTIP